MQPYHNGPVPDDTRSRTDLICLIVFLTLTAVMFGFGIYAWSSSSFSKLTSPYDPDGKGCGIDYPDYPLIYFASPHPNSLWVTVCVKKCPIEGDKTLNCQTNSVVNSCNARNDADETKNIQIYASTQLRGVVCLPTSETIKQQITGALESYGLNSHVSSIWASKTPILLSIPISIGVSLIFMLIIRFTAGCFIYILLGIAEVACIGLGIYLIMPISSDSAAATFALQKSRPAAIAVGALLLALATVLLILFICFRKRFQLASTIIQVSAKFVSANCLVLVVPLVLLVVLVLFTMLWIAQLIGYYSLGTPSFEQKQLPFQHYDLPLSIKVLGLVHVFYLFWVSAFLMESGNFFVAGTSTGWYYSQDSPLISTTKRYLVYHIGSVCMGSFFIALLGFIRFLYEFLTPESVKDENSCIGKWKKFCDCMCCVCLSLFKWFNGGAYTFINLAGETYCESAWKVVSKRLTEPLSSAVVMLLSIIFSTLARLGVTATTTFIIYYMLKQISPYKETVSDANSATFVAALLSFAIATFFMGVYSEAMDAIYVCFIFDKTAGGPSADDKCPPEMKNFLEEAKNN